MKRADTNLVEQLRLAGRANEDQHFHRLDQELIARLRSEAEAARAAPVFSRVVVPVDFSPHSRRALEYAADIAERFGSTVIVVHVIAEEVLEARLSERHPDRPFVLRGRHVDETGLDLTGAVHDVRKQAYDALREFLPARLLGQAGERHVELRVLIGQPSRRIADSAGDEDADLIVIGTQGRTGLSRAVTGSVAERVVRLARCPVLTVKAPA